MIKERQANPSIGDIVRLRLYTYNSNQLKKIHSLEKIEIFQVDKEGEEFFVEAFDETDVFNLVEEEGEGSLSIDVSLDTPKYIISKYKDVWHVKLEDEDSETVQIENFWEVNSSLWFSSTEPLIYDYKFGIRPNKIKKGSVKYIALNIEPIAPDASTIEKYYQLSCSFGEISLSIYDTCNECEPEVIVENVEIKEQQRGVFYYRINTKELDKGLYNIVITMKIGMNEYVSDNLNLQIY